MFVHPRRLEETAVVVASFKRMTIRVENDEVARCFAELQHVVAQANDLGAQRRFVIGWLFPALDGFVVAIALQLSAPQSAENQMMRAVIIFESAGINRITAFDGILLRDEWPSGLLLTATPRWKTSFYPSAKNKCSICRFPKRSRNPKAGDPPGNIFQIQNHAVIRHRPINGIH